MITENDPAGMGIAFTNAINRYTEHTCRLITTTIRYNFNFDKDIHVPNLNEEGFGEITELLENADLIHFHLLADENIELGPIKVKEFVKGKKIFHHHHGHPEFRANPTKYSQKYKKLRRKVLVSTPDLLKLLPEATWQPNLVPINDPHYLPLSGAGNGRVRICHSPTRKDLKNTAEFDAVVCSLQGRYNHVDKVIIENMLHQECLRTKQQCDIHFDHMQGYYGVSSLESLSQGKPVIAGLDDWNIIHIKEFTGSEGLPWVIAHTQDELQDRVEMLITDHDLRNKTAGKSRQFMEEHWSEQRALQVLLKVYGSL
ncbi:MAG: glycosyltransferase [Planctomycetota bacterium]|jgi:glycosyltransferase involved in cell wall biosynthesis